jgi:hypothetical protein
MDFMNQPGGVLARQDVDRRHRCPSQAIATPCLPSGVVRTGFHTSTGVSRGRRAGCGGRSDRLDAHAHGDREFGYLQFRMGVFTAAPAPGFVVALADLGDRFRLTANAVDLVTPDAPLPKLPVARAVWKPRPDIATSTEGWLLAGGPHHTVLSTAASIEALTDPAEIARTELIVIDEDSSVGLARQGAALEPGLLPPRTRSLTE